jgi:hypothetical protein
VQDNTEISMMIKTVFIFLMFFLNRHFQL